MCFASYIGSESDPKNGVRKWPRSRRMWPHFWLQNVAKPVPHNSDKFKIRLSGFFNFWSLQNKDGGVLKL